MTSTRPSARWPRTGAPGWESPATSGWRRTRPAAEVAIVVADEAHGKGVGRVLMEALAERGRVNGVQRFVAQTGAGNRPFRRLAERLGPTRVLAVEGGTIELETTL
jgi:GNAT superfamily N-acetyltransferase